MITAPVEIQIITNIVCNYYNIKTTHVFSKNRDSEIIIPRQMIQKISKELTRYSNSKIAENTGLNEGSTIINSCKHISDLVCTEQKFKEEYALLHQKCDKAIEGFYKVKEQCSDLDNNELNTYSIIDKLISTIEHRNNLLEEDILIKKQILENLQTNQ